MRREISNNFILIFPNEFYPSPLVEEGGTKCRMRGKLIFYYRTLSLNIARFISISNLS